MKLVTALALVATVALATFGGVSAQDLGKVNPEVAAVIRDNNAFATDLYAQLSKQDGNLFFSPYSISTALAMTYAGARAKTADEMASALHFGQKPGQLHLAFGSLVRDVSGSGKQRAFQLTTANALWGAKNYSFQPEFVKLMKEQYGAGVKELDFGNSEEARRVINGWIEEQTKDKIKNLIPEGGLEPDTRLVLTNAIYFKAAWAEAFNESATKKEDFKVSADRKVPVPMMHQNESLRYLDGGTFQMVEMPYESRQLSMFVLLPKKVGGLPELEKSFTQERFEEWRTKAKPQLVKLALPKFKVTAEFKMKDVLSAMGMKLAFVPDAADFSGMTTQEKLFID